MSQWTHINGSIRVDSIRLPGFHTIPLNLGIQASFEDNHEPQNIPAGSEGSLVWTKWTNPDQSALAAYTVNFFGDLRDYNDVQEIEKYLEQITTGQLIRSGICEVDVEFNDTYIYQYDTTENKWNKLTTIPYKTS
jgi:hypothetical protein